MTTMIIEWPVSSVLFPQQAVNARQCGIKNDVMESCGAWRDGKTADSLCLNMREYNVVNRELLKKYLPIVAL